jgi:hypothetical protein
LSWFFTQFRNSFLGIFLTLSDMPDSICFIWARQERNLALFLLKHRPISLESIVYPALNSFFPYSRFTAHPSSPSLNLPLHITSYRHLHRRANFHYPQLLTSARESQKPALFFSKSKQAFYAKTAEKSVKVVTFIG